MADYDLIYPGLRIDDVLETAYELQQQGYIFRGVASEFSGTPTERTWLITGEGSTGYGFTTAVPKGCVGICLFNGSTWSGKVVRVVTLDAAPTSGSTNAVQSGAVYSMVNTVATGISDALNSLTFQETTVSGDEGLKLVESLKMTSQGVTDILTSFTILAATTSKAGLLSASDKAKLDAILTNIRSMVVTDTTLTPNQGTELTESLKWTVGGVQEVISAFTILAATTSKAGLMSASDKAKLNTLFADGYKFAGIAVPSTVPMSTDAKIFYIATQAGTYTLFGDITLTDGINVLMYSGSAWSSAQLIGFDENPTANSKNLVTSEGIFNGQNIQEFYDLTILKKYKYAINPEGIWGTSSYFHHVIIPVDAGDKFVVKANNEENAIVAFLKNHVVQSGTSSLVDGTERITINAANTETLNIPNGCVYLYILLDHTTSFVTDYSPESIQSTYPLVETALLTKAQELTEKQKSQVKKNVGIPDDISISDGNYDLDISDEDQHVLARFYDGEIKTKNFDSKNAALSNKKDYTRRTSFSHLVNTTNFLITDFISESLNTYEAQVLYEDNCVLYLPTTYTRKGTPTKLIIFCKQGASTIEPSGDTILSTPNTGRVMRYMLYLGYGILAADGVPNGWADALGIGERAVGNYVAVQSTIRAFEYVRKHYNIDSERVFMWGYSQGGHYAQNVIDNSDIPIAAAAQLSPVCSMRYHQWDLNINTTVDGVTFTKGARLNIARIFDFPEVTTNDELLALQYDPSKTVGYDPWVRNVENPYTGFVQNSSDLWMLPSGTTIDDITMKKHIRCPLKIWAADNDTTLSSDVMKVFVKAIKNSGQVADIQMFTSGGHNIPTNQTAIGTFEENGDTVSLYPIALDVASWFYNFGGYPLK